MYTLAKLSLAVLTALIVIPTLAAADAAPSTTPSTSAACNCRTTMVMAVTRATDNVPIQNFSFGSTLNINVGDKVTWTNLDTTPHNVISDTGVFSSVNTLAQNQSFSFTFLNTGTFNYHCTIHNMPGTVVVSQAANQAPAITSALTDVAIVNTPYSYTLTATGTPTPTLSFTSGVPNGFNVNGATLSGTFTTPGPVSIGLQATSTAGTDTKTLVITVAQPPAITSPLTDTAVVGTPYTYTMTASGSPAPTLSYPNPPSGFTVNGAVLSGTFSAPGQVSIPLKATNAGGTDNQTLVVTVSSKPVITSALTDAALINNPYSYTLTATGSPTPTLSFGPPPIGFQINGATLSGTFTSVGPVTVALHATNSAGSDDETLTINVTNNAVPAAITSALTDTAVLGKPYTYTLTATGLPTPTLSFTSGVPTGFTMNGGVLSGTFTSGGQISIGLQAMNSAGTDNETLVVTVNETPAITSPLSASATVGTPFTYTLAASGEPAPTLSFTGVPGELQPNGATLSGTFSTPGNVTVGLHATNSAGKDDETLTIAVQAAPPPPGLPSITSALAANAIEGLPFTYTITASGATPITFTATGLPSTVTLTGNVISGTFTSMGDMLFVLKATNAVGSDTENLVVTVTAATEGVSGNWSGSAKGKSYDQTGASKPAVPASSSFAASLFQQSAVLQATVTLTGSSAGSYVLSGKIGQNNFWLAGQDSTGKLTLTLSGQVSKGTGIKGEGIVFSSTGVEEFTFTLKKQ